MSNPNPVVNQSRKRKSTTVSNEAVLSQQQAAINAAKRLEIIAIQRAKEHAARMAKINSNLYSGGKKTYRRKSYRRKSHRRKSHRRKSYRRR